MADNITVVTDELQEINQEATNIADEPTETEEGSTTETVEDDSKQEGEAASPEAEEKTEAESQEAKEGHSRFQKRIDKLTRQREEAIREAEQLRKELEAIKSLPKEEVIETLDPLDFDSYEDYIEAINSQPKKEPKVVRQETKSDTQKGVDPSIYRTLDDKFDEVREKYEDFDTLISDSSLHITTDMVVALSELDNAGEVAYYLAKNKDEAKRIAGLSPYKQAIEIGKLEMKVTAPKPQPEKKVTKAPQPIDPVNAGGDVVTKDPSKMSFAEYEAYMNKQELARRGSW